MSPTKGTVTRLKPLVGMEWSTLWTAQEGPTAQRILPPATSSHVLLGLLAMKPTSRQWMSATLALEASSVKHLVSLMVTQLNHFTSGL